MQHKFDTRPYREFSGEYVEFTWKDKPHRLIYDLCAEIERLQHLVATMRRLSLEAAKHARKGITGGYATSTGYLEALRMVELTTDTIEYLSRKEDQCLRS